MLGLGGGIFLVPALTLLFNLPVHTAVGASLIGVIATSAGVAVVSRPGRGPDVGLALRLEVFTTSGALAGSLLAGRLSAQTLSLVFATVAVASAAFTFLRSRRRAGARHHTDVEALFRKDYRPRNWPVGVSIAGLAGALSGLTGTGGGFIKVPVMYSVMDVPLGVATATSNFMVGITSAASALVYIGRGDVYPLVVVPTALGVFAGAISGARLAPRLRVEFLRTALIVVLVFVALQMFWKGLVSA
jgi:hypothetical protein